MKTLYFSHYLGEYLQLFRARQWTSFVLSDDKGILIPPIKQYSLSNMDWFLENNRYEMPDLNFSFASALFLASQLGTETEIREQSQRLE